MPFDIFTLLQFRVRLIVYVARASGRARLYVTYEPLSRDLAERRLERAEHI